MAEAADAELLALEARIVQQSIEHADLMLLARLKYLNREPQSDVIAKQIEKLSQRINARIHPGTVPGGGTTVAPQPPQPTPGSGGNTTS